MEAQQQKLNIFDDAQDIVVVRGSDNDNFVYAVKPSLEFQKAIYAESLVDSSERDVGAFNGHWKFDEKKGITGSSTFLALRLDKRALRPRGLWLPGLLEAKALERKGKLENGVYRDYGAVVYSDGKPNKEVARDLVLQVGESGLELPLIVSFRGLDYALNPDRDYGVEFSIVESSGGMINGIDAVRELESLDYKASSGVRGLDRDGDGVWGALWDDLVCSGAVGRVDWICGEATPKI
jgi:hypothetical protein